MPSRHPFAKLCLSFTLILLMSGCAGALIEKDRMYVGAVGKSYIKTCRMNDNKPVVLNEDARPELSRWVSIKSTMVNGETVTVATPSDEKFCVEIGNNTPPQGVWGKLFDFLGSVAPFVAMAFGIPAL